jgi:hypothetical protein
VNWHTVTTRYEPVIAHRTRKGQCPACGKPVTRSRTFQHTVNPFNKNPDGTVRTYEQVRERVNAEADAWMPDFRHSTERCKEVTP